MNDLKKRILLDLLVTPTTMLPNLLGASMMLTSEILGGTAAFFGFCSLAVGLGVMATNVLINYDKVAAEAIRKLEEEKRKDKNRSLDDLARKLEVARMRYSRSKNGRPVRYLKELRAVRDSFFDDIREGRIENAPSSLQNQVDEIFDSCVEQLERQLDIVSTANKLSGDLKEQLLEQRNAILKDVEASIAEINNVVSEIRVLDLKENMEETKRLQERLRLQLTVARRTKEVMNEVEGDDMSRFKEYTN